MSYTTILHLWPGEKCENGPELANAFGFGPVVWDALSQQYLGQESGAYLWSPKADLLWGLWKKTKVPMHQRAVLMMTYDRAYVLRADYPQAAVDIRLFLTDFPEDRGKVNHWQSIAAYFENTPECPAIGFHGTSVIENLFLGPWNEEKEQYDPADWSKTYDLYHILRTVK